MLAGNKTLIVALCMSAVFMALSTESFAQGRNCPETADQTVFVSPGQPVAFRLNVQNIGDAQLTIFQYPLGGVLQQSGPSSIDFTFVPQLGFNGTTEMTYRIIPPYDCARSVQLGRVQLVGGFTDGTATGLVPTLPPTICGLGSFAPLSLCAIALLLTPRTSRDRKP